ncbi:MAG TPA: chemotaxis protein CheB [Rudaea sp.]|jgi:two-component system chemotaxis response regulator CheB/chemosensory pili system protein ChpB (putative protein-glutamate methylesterase)
MPTESVPVALLYEAGDRGGHLKDALNELGAAIVYESMASNLDRAALAGSGARIVVFNLDPESEAQIDQVYEVLNQGGYEVVFNDADASAQLSGSDHARWARHLAAKILHKPEIAEPPRPAWAESVPRPGVRANVIPAAVESIAPVASPVLPADLPPAPPAAELQLEAMTEKPAFTPVTATSAPSPLGEVPTLELPVLDGFDLTDVEMDPGGNAAAASEAAAESDFASALEDFAAHVPAHQHHAPTANEFTSQLDALFADTRGSKARADDAAGPVDPVVPDAAAADGMAEFPAIFDQFDSAAASIPEALDGSFKPAALPVRPAESATAGLGEPLLPPEWSLEPLDENTEFTPPAGKAAAFGIETMTASDYLAPEDDEPAPPPQITPGLTLELMPMEDAVAPEAYAAAVPVSAGMRDGSSRTDARLKVGTGAPLRHVVVLGASIGGPEAVRDFLGALPRNFPALFVLAQHMGDEFLDLMSAQLAKAVKLTVRTPTHGERVGHGEVVIVPTRQRMQIDSEGVITLSPLIERTAYSPSIDQVLRDVADEFGARATAIVFSGMAQDAIEGSKYMRAQGAAVWVQDPDSCTISTMVDSVRQTGAVAYVGTPQQLATKMMADFGAE